MDWVTLYAQKVVNGEILASQMNIKSCQRHLDDLADPPDGYVWNVKESNKIIEFIEMLPDTKTNKPMPLMLFQKFIVGSLYGWRTHDGYRRFTKGYISMARKQGKSLLVSGLAQNELLFGHYPKFNRQIYVASSTYKQAQVIFKMVTQQLNMVRSKSDFIRQGTNVTKTEIEHITTSSTFAPLSNNPDAVDGKDPTVAILDELASMPDDEMYSRLKTGMTLQKNPMTLLVSTAGDNLNSQMYQEYKYVKRILDGKVKNENYFIYCAEMDSQDEVNDETMWIKAMPLLESEEHKNTILKNIKGDIQDEIEKGTSFHKILIKNFNLWQATKEDGLLNIDEWNAAAVDNRVDIYGSDVYVGVDLSKLDDLTSIAFIFPTDEQKMLIDTYSFIGTKTSIDEKIKRDKIPYDRLIDKGEAEVSTLESGYVDYLRVIEYIHNYVAANNLTIKAMCYDPWNSTTFITSIETMQLDWPLIEVSQTFRGLSQAIKQFRLWIAEKRLQHTDKDLLTIAVNNAVLIRDGEDNVKIDKKKNRHKIDPIISVVTAFAEAQYHEFQTNWDDVYASADFGF